MSDVHAAAATTCCANFPPGLTGPGPTPLLLIALLGCFRIFFTFFCPFLFLLLLDSSLPLGPHELVASYGVVVLLLALVLVAVPYLSLVRAPCCIQHRLLPSTC
jgi:hypothetical protein